MDDYSYRMNKSVMLIDPNKKPENDPRKKFPDRAFQLQLRQELILLQDLRKRQRKRRMFEQISKDFYEEGIELRKMGRGFYFNQL